MDLGGSFLAFAWVPVQLVYGLFCTTESERRALRCLIPGPRLAYSRVGHESLAECTTVRSQAEGSDFRCRGVCSTIPCSEGSKQVRRHVGGGGGWRWSEATPLGSGEAPDGAVEKLLLVLVWTALQPSSGCLQVVPTDGNWAFQLTCVGGW